jgi:hypothetical protein
MSTKRETPDPGKQKMNEKSLGSNLRVRPLVWEKPEVLKRGAFKN